MILLGYSNAITTPASMKDECSNRRSRTVSRVKSGAIKHRNVELEFLHRLVSVNDRPQRLAGLRLVGSGSLERRPESGSDLEYICSMRLDGSLRAKRDRTLLGWPPKLNSILSLSTYIHATQRVPSATRGLHRLFSLEKDRISNREKDSRPQTNAHNRFIFSQAPSTTRG